MKKTIKIHLIDMASNSNLPVIYCRQNARLPLKNKIKQGNLNCLSDKFLKE